MTQDEAKPIIIALFKEWCEENDKDSTTPLVHMLFFNYLRRVRPDLLDFQYRGDQYQTVRSWLL